MQKKLNSILLIDDDKPTNFLSKLIIDGANCTHETITLQSAKEALDFMNKERDGSYPQPDLIFLDINMPAMNGWEFLDEFDKLEENRKQKTKIVMMTTSLNPEDEKRASKISYIADFMNKPLNQECLQEILLKHFADRL
ncbi:MAG: response regulator [Cytophagaceae bacterium]|nr:response regulator [Cytophagaceae bacterium]